jgi:tetratricopeptide (TPR) repeat protein
MGGLFFGWLSSPMISIFLAILAPTISIVSINASQFTKLQVKRTLTLVFIVGLFLGVGAQLACSYFTNQTVEPVFLFINDLVVCIASLLIFFILSERLFIELLSFRTRISVVVGLIIFFVSSLYFFSLVVFNTVLIAYTALSLFDFYKNRKKNDAESIDILDEKKEMDILFKHKPNVHLLFMESIHSSSALKDIYGIDNSSTCDKLTSSGFTLYNNTYSNLTWTIGTISNLLWPRSLYDYNINERNIEVTPSKIISTFKDNGYHTSFFASEMLENLFSDLFDTLGSNTSTRMFWLTKNFAPLIAQSSLIRKLLSSNDLFEHQYNFNSSLEKFKDVLAYDRPQMNWFYFGACHSDLRLTWDKLDGFVDEYREKYFEAETNLHTIVDIILKEDPDSIIIAMGDHGARRFNHVECGPSDDPTTNIKEKGFSPHLIAQDQSSVFLAIHWPIPHFTQNEVITPVRLYDHIFAAMTGDRSHLDNMMPNETFCRSNQFGRLLIARDGKPLDKWEKIDGDKQLSFYLEEIKKDPKNENSLLELASKYLELGHRSQGIQLLQKISVDFPECEKAYCLLMKDYRAQGRAREAENLGKQALHYIPKSNNIFYELSLAAECLDKIPDADIFILKAVELADEKVLPDLWYIMYAQALARKGEFFKINETVKTSIGNLEGVASFIDWEMQYLAFLDGNNESIFSWIDKTIADSAVGLFVQHMKKKLILCMVAQKWSQAEETAMKLLQNGSKHVGVYLLLAAAQEAQEKPYEALKTLSEGFSIINSSILGERIGLLASKEKIYHPDFAPFKALAKTQLKEKIATASKVLGFDEKWYVQTYGDSIKHTHHSPLEHYLMNSNVFMYNPNENFDVAFYYMNNLGVFNVGMDAAIHYNTLTKYKGNPPRAMCVLDRSFKYKLDWKE